MTTERRRRYHQRSRAGCLACKERHVRCDEALPYCSKCLVTGSECHYPASLVANASTTRPVRSRGGRMTVAQLPDPTRAHLIDSFGFDPFVTLPINLPFNSSMLFHHFNSFRVLVNSSIPKPPGGIMLDVVVSDTALLHGAIILAANHWVMIGGLRNHIAASFYYHKVEMIKILRERMIVYNELPSDSTISAIAMLVLVECRLGFMDAAIAHMSGLEQLVKVRGDFGLNALPTNALMHRLLMLADLHMSTATNTALKFSHSKTKQIEPTSEPASHQAESSLTQIDSRALSQGLNAVNGLDAKTREMIGLLRHVSANSPSPTISSSNVSSAFPSSPLLVRFESLVYSIMHSIGPTNAVSISTTVTSACLGIAGTIYLHLFIKHVPFADPVYAWQLRLLEESLQVMRSIASNSSTRIMSAESNWTEVWLWIYFASGSATERQWHNKSGPRHMICRELTVVKQLLGYNIGDWERVQDILKQLIWPEDDKGIGLELWKDVCQSDPTEV